MHIVNTYGLKLIEGRLAHDASLQFRVGYALDGAAAGHASSVVSIVLEPGMAFGEHVDRAEEIIFVVDGSVEIRIGEESARVPRGALVVVPSLVPHSIRNIGPGIARLIGFFPSPAPMSSFTEPSRSQDDDAHAFGGLTAEPVAA